MTRKVTGTTHTFRIIAQIFVVLTVLLLVAASAQTRSATQSWGKERSGDQVLNSGPGLFVSAVAYGSGGYESESAVVGDLNGDGKLDLVVTNRCSDSDCQVSSGSVGVLLGNGDGTFRAVKVYASGGFLAQSVAIADLNGDHKPDLVVTNSFSGSNSVGVLMGNGDGTFQPVVIYGSGGTFPWSVAVADVNGDGKPDILVANTCGDPDCNGTVGVLLGNGNGTFRATVTYSSGGRGAVSVAIADVNHDGKPDLLVANECGGNCSQKEGAVAVLLGNGNGTFQTALSYGSGGAPAFSVTVADVNGDGNVDLLVANNGLNTVGVLLGNGDGTFQPAVTYGSDAGSGGSAVESVGVADVDGDGKPDLLVVNGSLGGNANNGGAVALLLGNGDGTFQGAVNYLSGGYQSFRVAAGDVNGDGRPDLLVTNFCSTNNNCGGTNQAPGSVGVLLNNVGAPPTTITQVSSANPADINVVVTYTATVTSQSGGTLAGTVLFRDGGTPVATMTLASNQAAYSTTYAVKGTHALTATYSGVLNTAAASESDVLTEVILKPRPTSTQVTTSGSPSFVGQSVTFTARVTSNSGAIPDGELVTFYDGVIAIGTGVTANGATTFTTSSLTAKTHTIKATYIGDVRLKPSSGSVTQVVNGHATTTTLTSSPNPSTSGQKVTFTATVTSTGPPPTGTVKFLDGATTLGSATVKSGVAILTKKNLSVGSHAITAQYSGDAASDKSGSAVVNQVVQ